MGIEDGVRAAGGERIGGLGEAIVQVPKDQARKIRKATDGEGERTSVVAGRKERGDKWWRVRKMILMSGIWSGRGWRIGSVERKLGSGRRLKVQIFLRQGCTKI